jgi:two-component system, cell cycle sensor histidine kinase and response regulator CckA
VTRVLIVDDKSDNLYYLEALLNGHGYEVASARHGAEALVKARRTAPDLVISDLLMPVMDGYTLLRHWNADPRLRDIPFIVYTATYTEPEDEELALKLGADAFILKPSEPQDFLARLEAVRERGSVRERAEVRTVEDDPTLLKEYSEALIRKLEEKSLQLEAANDRLTEDIRARIEAEAALRESEARFRQLAENIDDVFWLSDARDFTMFYVSPAYASVWGRPCEELYESPESWIEHVHPDDRERMEASLEAYASGAWDQTYRIVRPDDSVRWLRSRAYPVRDENGDVFRVAGVSRDVTDYRRMEAQLLQAQKMEAVGRLAGGIAHDFNNLLTAIMGPADLMLMDLKPDDPMRQDVEEIRSAADRAATLTRQLLAFSRQQILEQRPLNLNTLITDLDRLLGRVIGEDIELRTVAADDLGTVRGDPGQFEQVVLNLAINARDAMPDGGTLTIETANAELDEPYANEHFTVRAGSYVMLAVSDTGVGMDAEIRAQVFEPFFTTKDTGKGTGLGLSTVYGIVKQSQGYVWVYSEPGYGSTFKIYLPRVDERAGSGRSDDAHAPVRGTETILLVEDEELVQGVVRRMLESLGYHVLTAKNGREGLELAEDLEVEIPLVVTDVVMPGMGGRELAERLAEIRPESEVLFVSGYTAESVMRQQVLDNGVHFLQKPFTPAALGRKVRKILDGDAT